MTWFRNAATPSPASIEHLLPLVDATGVDIPEDGLARVWVDEESEKLALRAAYREAARLVRQGLEYVVVNQLGIITLVWREIPTDDGPAAVLQAHGRSPWIKRLVPALLRRLNDQDGDPAEASSLQVLDIRPNACADTLRIALGGKLTDAVAEIDDPAVPDDRASFSARSGRDLTEQGSKFGAYAHYPGRGRSIEYSQDAHLVRFTVSQVDYSTVFSETNLLESAAVFKEAVKVGTWRPFP